MFDSIPHLLQQWTPRKSLVDDLRAAGADVSYGTINQWRLRDSIPSQYHLDMVNAARRRGVALDLAELARLHADRPRRMASIKSGRAA